MYDFLGHKKESRNRRTHIFYYIIWISNQTTLYLKNNRTESEHSFGLLGLCPVGKFMFLGVEMIKPILLSLFMSYICLLKLYLKSYRAQTYHLERVDSYKTFYEHLPFFYFKVQGNIKSRIINQINKTFIE